MYKNLAIFLQEQDNRGVGLKNTFKIYNQYTSEMLAHRY